MLCRQGVNLHLEPTTLVGNITCGYVMITLGKLELDDRTGSENIQGRIKEMSMRVLTSEAVPMTWAGLQGMRSMWRAVRDG